MERGKLLLSCNCDLKSRRCSQGSDSTMGEEAPSPLGSGGHCGHQQLMDVTTAHGRANSSQKRQQLMDVPTAHGHTNSSRMHQQLTDASITHGRINSSWTRQQLMDTSTAHGCANSSWTHTNSSKTHQQFTDTPTAHGRTNSSQTRLTGTPTAHGHVNSSGTHQQLTDTPPPTKASELWERGLCPDSLTEEFERLESQLFSSELGDFGKES